MSYGFYGDVEKRNCVIVEAINRRRTTRHPASHNRARIEWAVGAEFRETEARLLDISGGGARFVADDQPSVGRSGSGSKSPR